MPRSVLQSKPPSFFWLGRLTILLGATCHEITPQAGHSLTDSHNGFWFLCLSADSVSQKARQKATLFNAEMGDTDR